VPSTGDSKNVVYGESDTSTNSKKARDWRWNNQEQQESASPLSVPPNFAFQAWRDWKGPRASIRPGWCKHRRSAANPGRSRARGLSCCS